MSPLNKRLFPIAMAIAVIAMLSVGTRLSATYFAPDARMHVVIDGLDYGPFDTVAGLPETGDDRAVQADGRPWRVTLTRSFVTDPSLYHWARSFTRRKIESREIQLVGADGDSGAVRRLVLRSCQPMTWTVESSDSLVGGFHETVELAAQEISAN